MLPPGRKACERVAALREILGCAHGRRGGGAGAAAVMDEARVHHQAAQALLAHCERELAVVAVEEAVALVEAAGLRQHRAPHREADPVDRGGLDGVALHVGAPLERVDDGASDVAAVAAQSPDAVEAGEADAGLLQRGAEARQPAHVAHLGVIVEEAEHVAAGQRRALIQRADEPDVLGVALVAQREGHARLAKERLGAVAGGVVDHAELERLAGATQALETGPGQRQLIEDRNDDADHGGGIVTPPAALTLADAAPRR